MSEQDIKVAAGRGDVRMARGAFAAWGSIRFAMNLAIIFAASRWHWPAWILALAVTFALSYFEIMVCGPALRRFGIVRVEKSGAGSAGVL